MPSPSAEKDPAMSVDRCVCHNLTFEQLKALAVQLGPDTTVDELVEQTAAGTGCSLCRPYLALMLQTGRTRFEVLDASSSPSEQGNDQTDGDAEAKNSRCNSNGPS